jgi:hypothetical protein
MQSRCEECEFGRRTGDQNVCGESNGDVRRRIHGDHADPDAHPAHTHAHRNTDPAGVSRRAVGVSDQRGSVHRSGGERHAAVGTKAAGDQGLQLSAHGAPAGRAVAGGWEFYTEFGNTRWVAMYYGTEAEKVGPIRSARVLDTRLVPHYDAILVHVQAFETVWQEISKAGIDTINEFPASCPAICRDSEEEFVENSAFGNTAELTKYAKRIGMVSGERPDLDGMVFDPAAPSGAKSAIGARIYFSSSATAQWKYDEATNRYLRFSENDIGGMVPLDDRMGGKQLAVDNVIVLLVDIFTYVGKTGTGEQLDMDLSTSGNAFFFRDGVVVQGSWKSGGPNTPLQFLDSQDQTYALHPGTTYFAIIGKRNIGAAAATTEWHFYVPAY